MKTITESGYAVFTEKNVKTEDMRKKSDLDEKKLIEYMKKYPGLSGIEKNLIELQNRYNVNALLLLAIVRLESGNGRSDIAEKRNNFGGIVGWEKSVRVFVTFDSREDCLNYMADLLSEQYLTSSGRFFNGYSLTAISKKYSASPENWLNLVSNLILEIQSGINET
ncbi:MAG: glucosaminidase domain-containing protein [Oscillospiraceae bacterium]|nr:glucosaminidase domain-containing protein [Oscillospiraceae bacterium]